VQGGSSAVGAWMPGNGDVQGSTNAVGAWMPGNGQSTQRIIECSLIRVFTGSIKNAASKSVFHFYCLYLCLLRAFASASTNGCLALLPGQVIMTPSTDGAALVFIIEITLKPLFDVIDTVKTVFDE